MFGFEVLSTLEGGVEVTRKGNRKSHRLGLVALNLFFQELEEQFIHQAIGLLECSLQFIKGTRRHPEALRIAGKSKVWVYRFGDQVTEILEVKCGQVAGLVSDP